MSSTGKRSGTCLSLEMRAWGWKGRTTKVTPLCTRRAPEAGRVQGINQADSTDKVIGDSLSVTHDHGQWTLFQPIYTQEDLDAVQVVGRTPVTLSDKLAHGAVKFMR